MKQALFIFHLLLIQVCSSQHHETHISYAYLYSPEWDKMIQTYNSTRPFLTEEQGLLQHGLNLEQNYVFPSSTRFAQGINIGYSLFQSQGQNANFNNHHRLHFFQIGYFLRWKANDHFFTDIGLVAKASLLTRKINGKPYRVDEKKFPTKGIGPLLFLKTGWLFSFHEKFKWSPSFYLQYSPYFFAPGMEAVINQTKGLVANNQTGLLLFGLGITVQL